jgi:Kef-type K+ transport system membrane component KefB
MDVSFGRGLMTGDELLHELLALSAVIVMTRVLGLALRRIRQPVVVGEIVAGLALGPSLLGWIAPDAFGFLFPPTVVSFLSSISRLGVILYMFLVGLEIDPLLLRRQSLATVAIAQSSVIAPFVLGA